MTTPIYMHVTGVIAPIASQDLGKFWFMIEPTQSRYIQTHIRVFSNTFPEFLDFALASDCTGVTTLYYTPPPPREFIIYGVPTFKDSDIPFMPMKNGVLTLSGELVNKELKGFPVMELDRNG